MTTQKKFNVGDVVHVAFRVSGIDRFQPNAQIIHVEQIDRTLGIPGREIAFFCNSPHIVKHIPVPVEPKVGELWSKGGHEQTIVHIDHPTANRRFVTYRFKTDIPSSSRLDEFLQQGFRRVES